MCVGPTLWYGWGGVVSVCRLKHYWSVHVECGGVGFVEYAYSYALHILQNQKQYGQMNSTMTLLKPLNNPSLLLPYEQYYIQSLHHEGKLIPEQSPGETNPLFQTAINL